MRVCGIEIICMVLVWLNGRMVENILGIIIEINGDGVFEWKNGKKYVG